LFFRYVFAQAGLYLLGYPEARRVEVGEDVDAKLLDFPLSHILPAYWRKL
jgi:hypothetical protein